MSIPPPSAPGGQPPVGQPAPYGPPPGGPGGYGPPPGQPGNYAPPPGQPGNYAPPSVPPHKPKRMPLWLRILIPVVVTAAAIIFSVVHFFGSPASANVGECLVVKEFKNNTEPAKAGCEDSVANVKIGAKLDNGNGSCPTGNYDEFSVTGRSSYKLCLMINAKQGDCLANFTANTEAYRKVSCTDPAVDAKIVKAVDGKSSEDECEGTDATNVALYSQPATTMCIKKTGA